MLVLSRRLAEGLTLRVVHKDGTEKEVKIKIVEIGPRKVRLGLEADRDVIILREELVNRQSA